MPHVENATGKTCPSGFSEEKGDLGVQGAKGGPNIKRKSRKNQKKTAR